MGNENQKTSTLDEHVIQIVKSNHPKTVKQLVELVQQQHPLPQEEIIDHVLILQNQGRLNFKEDAPPARTSLRGYLSSSPAYWYWITITLALATTTTALIIPEDTIPIVYARYLLGFIFVLFLPGYSFIKVLFPEKDINNIERTALSIGISIAIAPITVLLLNYTPWGITTTTLTLSLLALTTILATAAIARAKHT